MDYGYGGGDSYTTTSYGQQGGAGGGGFMPGSQASPSGAKRELKNDSLRPVTIKQLYDAQDSGTGTDFYLDNEPFRQIALVGQVRNVTKMTINIGYKIDDGTGTIDVKSFTQEGEDPEKLLFKQDIYVKVFGHLKVFHKARSVIALRIRPIEDFNEINHHFLEATLVHLKLTRGSADVKVAQQNRAAAQSTNEYDEKMEVDSGAMKKVTQMSANAKKIFQHLQNAPQSHEGVNMHDIARAIGIDANACRRAGAELLDEGVTYSTVDEDTWAVLDSGI